MNILNDCFGWKLRHALNGGEKQICGYLLDGYDEDNNIIFEYDEPHHHTKEKRKKDLIRQNNILKYFKSINKKMSFWRYDVRYKNLYEVKL